jgi:hypothetical protein
MLPRWSGQNIALWAVLEVLHRHCLPAVQKFQLPLHF